MGFRLLDGDVDRGMFAVPLSGLHNVRNALAAIAVGRECGIDFDVLRTGLAEFKGVKRRLEVVGTRREVVVIDDFAHHPTAIATTLDGLRKQVGEAPIVAVIEPRSNSMKLGAHRDGLPESVAQADQVIWYAPPNLGWDLGATATACPVPAVVCDSLEAIIARVKSQVAPGTQVVIMSNGGFGGLHGKLAKALAE